jgi:hypothetical protein
VNTGGPVYAMAVEPNDEAIGGGASPGNFALLLSDGSLDPDFLVSTTRNGVSETVTF